MENVIREYGKAILTSVSVLLLLVFCMHGIGEGNGLLSVLANQMPVTKHSYQLYEDSTVYQFIMDRKEPTITYCGDEVRAGEEVDLQALFYAADADGLQLDIHVEEIEGAAISQVTYHFVESGIYEAVVSARDAYGVETRKQFKIPVQRKR